MLMLMMMMSSGGPKKMHVNSLGLPDWPKRTENKTIKMQKKQCVVYHVVVGVVVVAVVGVGVVGVVVSWHWHSVQ